MRTRETDDAVAEVVRRMYAAYPDSDQFDQYLHPQITIWESDQPGPRIGLAELQALRDRRRQSAAEAVTARLSVEDILVDRWSDGAAVARYLLHADTPTMRTSFRVTDVFDGLQIVHHHAEQL